MPLTVESPFTPQGDQPQAIAGLVQGLEDGLRFQTLLGATGTGKTFTMAKVIEAVQRPALVLAPNKILTAQLAGEFKEFFPSAAVEFFISYYDYYQPEAYVPARDLFIEKDANINMELERLRHSTTRSLLTRKDVIVVASVSAIYGLGSPDTYQQLNLILAPGQSVGRDAILSRLVRQQYERNDIELAPGRFRAKGDVIEVWAAYEEAPLRIELWGDEVDRLVMIDPITGDETQELESATVFPAKHYVTPFEQLEPALEQIERDLAERLELLERSGKLLEKQRLKERTLYDNGQFGFTHLRLRKAWGILHRAAEAGHVFTFLEHGNPRTTSPLEGGINAQIRHLLRHHRGMTIEHRRRAVEWFLLLHEIPIEQAHEHADEPTPQSAPRVAEEPHGPALYDTGLTAEEGLWHRSGWIGDH